MSDLSMRLRFIRELRDKTQADVAAALDVDPSTVTLWESGKHTPSTVTVRALASFFDVEPAWILAPWDDLRKEIAQQGAEIAHQAGMPIADFHGFLRRWNCAYAVEVHDTLVDSVSANIVQRPAAARRTRPKCQ